VQRKIFRVEQMLGKTRERAPVARAADTPQDGAARELALIRERISRSKHELTVLWCSAAEPRMTRAAYELGAAIDGMEKATQKILNCGEAIDESARTLAATLKTGYERGLAQDIQDQVMRIYETCNFQDLAGQRISKAIAALQAVEEHVTRMMALWEDAGLAPHAAAPAAGRRLVNGPKLDGDVGHASQSDIDAMFARPDA
jgi:chemotaxis protein CheZ